MEWRRWIHALRARLRAVVRPRRAEHDLHDELSFHVAMQTQANVQNGMSGPEAERRARVALGGVEQAKESSRDVRPLRWLDTLAQDLRYAQRSLRRAPGFTVVALLTLALGIGANTAIFSIVNGVILRPLGYPSPEQLMFLTTRFAGGSAQFSVSPPEYFEFRELNRSFSAVGAYRLGEVDLTGGDRPQRVRAAFVDEHLLNALGVQPAHGRLFVAGETDVSAGPPPALVILSHELWQTAFGGQPIVGQAIEVSRRRGEVLGIMPPGADLMDSRAEIWLPLGLNPANRQIRGNHSLFLIGRLKDGVTAQSAQTELDALIGNWSERVGIQRGTTGAAGHVFAPLRQDGGHILQMEPVQEEIVGAASRSIWVLQAAVGLVLLIACANLANLLLARAETRHRELAVRTALGASRGRLLRQFMTEGVLLSIAGGALGLWLARTGVQALIRAYPTTLPRTNEVAIDPLVLLFTLGVSTAAGVIFGLAPIVHTRVNGLPNALKDAGRSGAMRQHVRGGLVAAEIALAVILVTGAGLLARTVYNLTTVDAGFDRSRLVTFSMTLSPVSYPPPSARAQMFQRLLERLRALPGVQAATAMTGLPPARPLNAQDTNIDNYTAPPEGPGKNVENVAYYQNVMSDYFETMGIPIVEGRSFQPSDAASSGMVAVVNETLVNTFWKGLNPIGQRLRPCCFPGAADRSDQVPWFTVIGVARDVKQGGVDQEAGTEFYQLVDQRAAAMPLQFRNAPATMNVVLRTTLPLTALSPTLQQVVREVDRTVPIVRLREMESVFDESIERPRLLAQLVGAFAGLALLLAVIGTYGVLSYTVTARRREIGIRLALGADRARVQMHVMKQGLLLTGIGLLIGLAGAFGANRLIRSLLFGVQPTDVPTLASVAATIALVAAMASWLPAWRASRLDPNVVLRDE
jgi:predicted permease